MSLPVATIEVRLSAKRRQTTTMTTTRAWRQLPRDLLRFATTELHELHIAVMCVFEDAAVLQPALTFDDVRTALSAAGWDEPLDDARLRQTLDALKEWRLLDVTQDHTARYATPEEFELDLLLDDLGLDLDRKRALARRLRDGFRREFRADADVLKAVGETFRRAGGAVRGVTRARACRAAVGAGGRARGELSAHARQTPSPVCAASAGARGVRPAGPAVPVTGGSRSIES
jgi:hypothetical protein